MAPRTTRAKAKAPTKPEPTTTSSQSKHNLPAASSNPPKILILPNTATAEARIVLLINPRYSKATRYLICPETGAYEFRKIAAPKTTPRSWLIEDATTTTLTAQDDTTNTFDAQVTKGADLYLATRIDPLFLALPALSAQFSSSSKRMFLASDDHLETTTTLATNPSDDDDNEDTPQQHTHLRDTLARWPTWRAIFEARMATICDVVHGPGGPEDMLFRFSEAKLLHSIVGKATRVSERHSTGGGLPKSMDDKFVGKALEAPVVGVKRSAAAVPSLKTEASSGASEGGAAESQSSVATTATGVSEATTAATSVADGEARREGGGDDTTELVPAITPSAEVIKLQRIFVTFRFICSNYVPTAMAAELKKMLLVESGKVLVDFTPLKDYAVQLKKLQQEALLARSTSDYSRKRGCNDEENEDRAEKRRKKEEEDKRKKAGESLGVKRLKKVNTAGMQKLSAFFKPKGSS